MSIYTTFIELEGHCVKIWGQDEKATSLYIEKALMQMKPHFDAGAGVLSPDLIKPGLLCCAKFKDDLYYRACINHVHQQQGVVEVVFIDYGNRDLLQPAYLRSLKNFPPVIMSIPPQARAFILAQVKCCGPVNDPTFEVLSNEIRYLDFQYEVVGHVGAYALLALRMANGQNLAEVLVARNLALPLSYQEQQVLLQQSTTTTATEMAVAPTSPLDDLHAYKSNPLAIGSEHTVYVSYVSDGPNLFAIQQQHKENELRALMVELNRMQLTPVAGKVASGDVCLARSSDGNYICRAIIVSLIDQYYKVFFVDFGNTEVLPLSEIFQIPFRLIIPKVMAANYRLSGLPGPVISLDMKVAFKKFVNNKVLRMRVANPEVGYSTPSCELWNEAGVSALDFVRSVSLQAYPNPVSLTRGFNQEVKVSFVFSCKKFYVQLLKKEGELTKMMQDLQTAMMHPLGKDQLKVNMPCIALYTDDRMYYRAEILSAAENKVTVRYVDYGNEETVTMANIRAPIIEFITNLRPQALECCLAGYQNMERDEERDGLLEELILEQNFIMKVVDTLDGKILVDLINEANYNVASLLLDRMAKQRSQISPALVQDSSTIDLSQRRSVPNNRYSPRGGRGGSGDSETRPSPRQQGGDWRSKESRPPRVDRPRPENIENNGTAGKRNENSSWGEKPSWRDNRRDGENERKPHEESFGGSERSPRNNKIGSPQNHVNSWGGQGDGMGDTRNSREDRAPRYERPPRRDYSGSEKSSFSTKRSNPEENISYAELTSQFSSAQVLDTEQAVTVSWFYNPTNFYCQLLSTKEEFEKMMRDIQVAYKHRKPLDAVDKGSSVIAQFADDKVLYRAVVIESMSGSGHKVMYVDYGNSGVSAKVFQVESRFMTLPTQAIHCSLKGAMPKGGDNQWDKASNFGKYFGHDSMQCKFANAIDANGYNVELTANGRSILEDLQAAGCVAAVQVPYKHFDITYLASQQIHCMVESVNSLNDFILEILPGLKVKAKIYSSESAEHPDVALLKSFAKQFVLAYVDEVEDDRIIVTLYDMSGKHIPAREIREGIFDSISPISPGLVIGPYLTGFVAHATPTTVYMHADYLSSHVEMLLERLFEFYDTMEAPADLEVQEVYYAVKSVDGNWYRGLVTKIEDTNITVLFVDYGNEEVVDKSALRILHPEFFISHLAIGVVLPNAEIFLDKDITVSVKFVEEDLIGEVVEVDSASIVQPSQPVADMNQQELTPAEEAVPSQEVQLPTATAGDNDASAVIISHWEDPGEFYLQYAINGNEINIKQDKLQQDVAGFAPMEVITLNSLCAALFDDDGTWYRAWILKVDGDKILVQFVDFGNNDLVERTNLRGLSENYAEHEPYAKLYSLGLPPDNQWTPAALKKFEEIVETTSSYTIEIIGEEDPVTFVKLYAEDVCVNDVIFDINSIDSQNETSLNTESSVNRVGENEIAPSVTPIGSSVVLSHFDNPGQFYLQQSAALDAIADLQEELQAHIESLPAVENISTGIICAAPYSADNTWYRAQVLDADTDITTVRYIDYGNTDVLGSDIKIKTLPPELLSLEEHAKRCSLHLTPTDGEWSTESCAKFEQLTDVETPLTAEIVHQDEKSTFVKLYVNGVCINDLFVRERYASEPEPSTCQSFTGFVSHLNSPAEFWIQFEHACGDLESIADQLTSAEKFKPLEDQAPGTLCAAVFVEDENWYRARILSNTVAGVEVLFIDYGNSCTCSLLRELPEELVMMPPLAHKCSLLKPDGVLEWPVGATEKFRAVSADGIAVFNVIKHSQGETDLVQLVLKERDISDMLKPETADATVLNSIGLSEIYLRMNEREEDFKQLQIKLQELECVAPASEEGLVAALHEGQWYRAKVYGSIVDRHVVQLIDIGSEVDVLEFRNLPEDLAACEPLAMTVKMLPVVGSAWTDDSYAKFLSMVAKNQTVQVEILPNQVVRIYIDGVDVRSHIPSIKCTPASSVHSTPKKVARVTDPDESVGVSPIDQVLGVVEGEFVVEKSDVTMKTVGELETVAQSSDSRNDEEVVSNDTEDECEEKVVVNEEEQCEEEKEVRNEEEQCAEEKEIRNEEEQCEEEKEVRNEEEQCEEEKEVRNEEEQCEDKKEVRNEEEQCEKEEVASDKKQNETEQEAVSNKEVASENVAVQIEEEPENRSSTDVLHIVNEIVGKAMEVQKATDEVKTVDSSDLDNNGLQDSTCAENGVAATNQ